MGAHDKQVDRGRVPRELVARVTGRGGRLDIVAEIGQPCTSLVCAVYGPRIDVPGIVGDRLPDRLECRQLGVDLRFISEQREPLQCVSAFGSLRFGVPTRVRRKH